MNDAQNTQANKQANTQAKNRVLIVEDDSFLSDLLANKFATGEFDMTYAASGKQALEIIGEDPTPDLILLDIRLPDMDGYEVLQAMKQNPKTAAVPVIVFSNFGAESDIAKSKELGALRHLVKVNVSLSQLTEIVKNELTK
ncbi:MAG: response regulator [bacterium]|nr:response regulator [bacterium]